MKLKIAQKAVQATVKIQKVTVENEINSSNKAKRDLGSNKKN